MRALDYIIAAYYFPLRKFKDKGLEGGILFASLPLSLILSSIVFYSYDLLFSRSFGSNGFILYGLTMGISFWLSNSILRRKYLPKLKKLDVVVKQWNGIVKGLLIWFGGILFYLFSLLILFYSFRFI